jgi:cytosine/adenosine deaminase-related metal-dependent hydrolase
MLGTTAHMSADQLYWATLHGSSTSSRTGHHGVQLHRPAAGVGADGRRQAHRHRGLRGLEYHWRQAEGTRDSGIRFVDAAGMDVTAGTPDEVFDRFAAEVAHTRTFDADYALGSSIMGQVQWSPHPDAAAFEVEAMRRYGVTNQAHFLESPEAVEHQQSKFALYRDAGALELGLVFGHFIQTTPEIIAQSVAGGAAMSWQPASNGRLASGIALVPEMLAMGMKVGVGLDDQACTDVSDPWQNMRIGIYAQRARAGSAVDDARADAAPAHPRIGRDHGRRRPRRFARGRQVRRLRRGRSAPPRRRAALAPGALVRAGDEPAQPEGRLRRRSSRER